MNLDEFRREIVEFSEDAERMAASLRDPYLVLDRLEQLYNRSLFSCS
jgi:hypothetical protein